ncbi:putative laccase [Medicago truncatula]|uniref:Laccase n=1 Tax=Medicago truncatula TaxID=3880 RepID=G7JZP3_MEDTR|nr:laccase-3 [Medicago truncatula]AES98819.1 laccase/diphenol oxidase family protein [Medicago truncatula]RHN56634.1 putative laccase [Medicago truncatula]
MKTILCYLLGLLTIIVSFASAAENHYHQFVIQTATVKRLCKTRRILTVNGQFPGPTIEARDGDSMVIKVTNAGPYNISIHWHGFRMLRNPWADGPSYVTQCPIQPGGSYTYRFTIQNQEGTLWWHAHTGFLRATVYGAFIIYPKMGSPYPFSMPTREFPILLGEWFDRDPMALLRQTQFTGAPPNVSVAYTMNGQPGDLYRCSSQGTVRFQVYAGETILLRIINSALNQELFFSIANHRMTVVAMDAAYTKPSNTRVLMIGPGQTINVLVTADQPPGRYYMAARAYQTAMNAAFDNTTTTAILEYRNRPPSRPILPVLPFFNDTATSTAFTSRIRGLSKIKVFQNVDVSLLFTVGLGLINCTNPNSPRCQGPNGTRFAASINNNSFVLPRTTSLMQAYYNGVPGIFTTDFPPVPPIQFNYTGNVPRGLWTPRKGTKLFKLKYGSNVQIVLQDTSIVTVEDHPMHVHGFHFFVVGSGFGNFNPRTDPATFNLVDPPVRNTIGTPPGGWVAIRFKADNPGIWFLHCHIDSHLNWGLGTALLVENGVGPLQSVIPPPPDLPQC